MRNIHAALIVKPGKVAAFINELLTELTAEGISCSVFTTNITKDPPAPFVFQWMRIPAWAALTECMTGSSGNIINGIHESCDIVINLSGTTLPASVYAKNTVLEPSILQDHHVNYYPLIASMVSAEENAIPGFILHRKSASEVYSWKQGWFKSALHSYSRTLHTLLEGTVRLLTESIVQFSKGLITPAPVPAPSYAVKKISSAKFLRVLLKHKTRHHCNNLFNTAKWNTGIADMTIDRFISAKSSDHLHITWHNEAPGLDFKADPFGIHDGDSAVMFLEYYKSSVQKGELHQITDGDQAELMNDDVHLSYPYTFQHNNEWYCIPEKSKAGCIDLYRYDVRSKKLVVLKTLITNFAGVDNSIIHYQNKWWLFSTDASRKGADIRLHIFHADNLTGEWSPHACNPVKTDIRSARCGGTLFIHQGKLYRPAQDSSKGYGAELCIMEITSLTSTEFKEHEVNRITPSMTGSLYPDGIHTLSAFGNKTLIDGKRMVFSMRNFYHTVKKKYA